MIYSPRDGSMRLSIFEMSPVASLDIKAEPAEAKSVAVMGVTITDWGAEADGVADTGATGGTTARAKGSAALLAEGTTTGDAEEGEEGSAGLGEAQAIAPQKKARTHRGKSLLSMRRSLASTQGKGQIHANAE